MSKLIPKLRFSEFTERWLVDSLGTVTEVIDSLHITPDEYIDHGIPMIRVTDVNNRQLDLANCLRVSEKVFEDFTKKHRPGKGDIIMSRVGTCGASIKIDTSERVCLGQNTVLLRPKIDGNFLHSLIRSRKIQNQVDRKVVGSTQKTLSLKDLKKFIIIKPSVSEQQKIASFLSSVDEKIQQLTRKKELLEQYKKGVMQQLFSGKLRFKDENGKAYPKWETKRIEDLCSIARSGGTPKSTVAEFYKGEIPFLSISDMTTQGKYLRFTTNHISKLGLENSASWIVPSNSIIYSMYASVGFVAINRIPLATSQAVLNLILKEGVNTEFVYYSLIEFQKKVAKYVTTGTQGNLNAQTVKSFEIDIPIKNEQQKIANYLSAIDTKIENVANQIIQTQTFKKGLLQQMFV